ncbi:MAG: hypothetical protein KDD67_07375 [Ignavibacteriae bacterium]|nr:hypothetical protein [Ignavibacteriota bacterium]
MFFERGSAQVDSCFTDSLVISTGWNHTTNSLFGVGSYTTFWQVVSDPSPSTTEPRPASVIAPFSNQGGGWGGPLAGSQWISSYPSANNDTNGFYEFEFCFCITGRPNGVKLIFDILADDRATVYVNGTQVATTTMSYAFLLDSVTSVNTNITNLVNSGVNCVRVVVQNTNNVAMGLDIRGYIKANGLTLQNLSCCSDSTAMITGTKFFDLDCDGVRDSGEVGLAGWTITLSNGMVTTTDGLGNYYFNNLPSGTYTVNEIQQSGWTQSFPPFPGSHTVSIVNGQVTGNLDFGNCDTTSDDCIETRNDTTICFNDGVTTFAHTFQIRSLLPCPFVQNATFTALTPGVSITPTSQSVSAMWTTTTLYISGPGALPGSTVQVVINLCCTNPWNTPNDTIECCSDTLTIHLDCGGDEPCFVLGRNRIECLTDSAGVTYYNYAFSLASTMPCQVPQQGSITVISPASGLNVVPSVVLISGSGTQNVAISGSAATPGTVVGLLLELCCTDPATGINDCCSDTIWVRLPECESDTCHADSLNISTGWDPSSNTLLTPGATTSQWQVVSDPISTTSEPRPANVIAPFSPWWPFTLPGSQWINALPTANNQTTGLYAYERTFCISEAARNVVLNATLHTDNWSRIFINGTQIGATPPNRYLVPTTISNLNITSLVVPGINTMRVEVTNTFVPNLNASGLDLAGWISGTGLQQLNCCTGTITGMKYNDLNCNGQKDSGEPGLPGWTITLSNGSTTTTNSSGIYTFPNLEPGTYVVGEVQQSGWTQTFPATPGTHTVNVVAGQTNANIDFGNCIDPCKNCCRDFPKPLFSLQWSSGNGNTTVGGIMQAGSAKICTVSATLVDVQINGQPVVGQFVPANTLGGTVGTIPNMHEVVWTGVDVNAAPTPFSLSLHFPPIAGNAFTDRISYCIRYRFTDSNCVTCDTLICVSQRRYRRVLDFFRSDDELQGMDQQDNPDLSYRGTLEEEGKGKFDLTLPEIPGWEGDVFYSSFEIVPTDPSVKVSRHTVDGEMNGGHNSDNAGSQLLSPMTTRRIDLEYSGGEGRDVLDFYVTLHFSPANHPEVIFSEEIPLRLIRSSRRSTNWISGQTPRVELYQSFPNPAGKSVTIPFQLSKSSSEVSLILTDASGQVLKRLIENQSFDAGTHEVKFSTDGMSAGAYFYTLRVDGVETSRPMQVVR